MHRLLCRLRPSAAPIVLESFLFLVCRFRRSRLSHSHTQQFYFVMQTMLLWREVLSNIFTLWNLAEDDFINGACGFEIFVGWTQSFITSGVSCREGQYYRLQNTGQGLHRVQPVSGLPDLQNGISGVATFTFAVLLQAPGLADAMSRILSKVKKDLRVRAWRRAHSVRAQ